MTKQVSAMKSIKMHMFVFASLQIFSTVLAQEIPGDIYATKKSSETYTSSSRQETCSPKKVFTNSNVGPVTLTKNQTETCSPINSKNNTPIFDKKNEVVERQLIEDKDCQRWTEKLWKAYIKVHPHVLEESNLSKEEFQKFYVLNLRIR